MGTNKFRGCGSPAGSQGGDEEENVGQKKLQKLHITDGELIHILEQGCYMPPEKGQGNKNIQIKEIIFRML